MKFGRSIARSIRFFPAAFFVSSLLGNTVFGQTDDEAFARLMEEGVQHYRAGSTNPKEYEAAIESFKKAKKIQSIPDVTYNIARSYHKLGKCPEALETYREFAMTSAQNAATVKDYIQELNTQCGNLKAKLNLTCIPSQTMVQIGHAEAVPCNGVHELPTGVHQLKFTAEGYSLETREVGFSTPADVKSLKVELKPSASTPHVANSQTNASKATTTLQDTKAAIQEQASLHCPSSNGSGLGDKSALFWAGVGTGAGGVILSVVGGALLGNAYRKVIINDTAGFYEKKDGYLAGGGVLLGIGAAAALAGIGMIIADVVVGNDDTSQAFRVIPSVSVGSEFSSASLTIEF